MEKTVEKVLEAIELVKNGTCKRVDVTSDVKVYAVGSVIRIDVKV